MKRKQILARAITLGLLLAMPVGGAMAADLTIDSSNTGKIGAEWNPMDEGYYIYNTGSLANNTITIDGAEVRGNAWTVYEEEWVDEADLIGGYDDGMVYVDNGKRAYGANVYGAYARKDNNQVVSNNQVIMNSGSTKSDIVARDFITKYYPGLNYSFYEQKPQTQFNTGSIVGGQSDGDGSVTGNIVTAKDSMISGDVIGGQSNGAGTVSNNEVNVENCGVHGSISLVGGYATAGAKITGNKVIMNGGTVRNNVYGGLSDIKGTGDVTHNSVEITGGIIGGSWIAGGQSETGTADENSVAISGNVKISSGRGTDIYGGISNQGATANDNIVTISNVNKLDAKVHGGNAAVANNNKVILTNVEFGYTDYATHENQGWSAGGGSGTEQATGNEVVATNVKLKGGLTGGASTNDASNNKVTVSGADTQITLASGTVGSSITGGSSKNKATGNIVTIEGGVITGKSDSKIVAGEVTDNSSYIDCTAEGNTVQINGGTVDVDIYGGWGQYGSAVKNTVVINDGTISGKQIVGSLIQRDGTVTGNNITISGGEFTKATEVIGGLANADYKDEVNISQNTITVTESANDLDNVSMYGAKTDSTNAQLSNNALVIDGWRGTVNTIGGVTDLQFEHVDLSGEGGVLSAVQDTNLTGVKIAVNSLKEGSDLAAGTEYTIIDCDTSNITFDDEQESFVENIDASGNGVRVHDVNAATSKNNLVANITKSVLSNVYVAEDGTATSNDLVIGEGFATNASVVAGAYASGDNTAVGGSVTISGTYDGDIYAGYSESGEGAVGANTITLQDGADVGALYGSNTKTAAGSLVVEAGSSKAASVADFAGAALAEDSELTTETVAVNTLTNDGKLTASDLTADTLTNSGKLNGASVNAGTITNSGTLEAKDVEATTLVNNSNSTIKASGNVKANGELTNNGTLTGADVDAATLTNNSELIANGDVTAASINNSGDKFIANGDVTAASINNSGDEFIVKGNVKTGALTNSGIADVGTLTMSDNSTITANGGSLTADTITANNSNIIANGGKVDAGTITTNELAINTTGNAQEQVVIDTLVGDGLTLNVDTLEKNQVVIGNYTGESVSVIGSSSVTDNLGNDLTSIEAGMQNLADTLNIKSDGAVKELVAEKGSVLGTITGTVDANGNLTVTGEDVNSFNQGVSEMASIALMTWRQENNDMNKRLGELRDSAGEHGVWVRMTRGESKYGAQNIKNQYNAYQLGYDEKLSVDKNWTVGAALTYTDANSSFSGGKGENKHKGIALYGSRLNDDGSFIDLIARYARLEHDFDVRGGAGKGDFDTNGYSLSAEYGKRFTGKSGLWLEPQVELTYGRVSSANYVTDRGVMVRQDDMDSLVGRLGFALGQNLSKGKGNVYLRASYLYDFEGETDARFMNATQQQRGFEQDLGGGWWEVGVGANINLSEATHLYFDVEKTYGGNVATPWQWNAGVRWSF